VPVGALPGRLVPVTVAVASGAIVGVPVDTGPGGVLEGTLGAVALALAPVVAVAVSIGGMGVFVAEALAVPIGSAGVFVAEAVAVLVVLAAPGIAGIPSA
jgi:hypothetical protein